MSARRGAGEGAALISSATLIGMPVGTIAGGVSVRRRGELVCRRDGHRARCRARERGRRPPPRSPARRRPRWSAARRRSKGEVRSSRADRTRRSACPPLRRACHPDAIDPSRAARQGGARLSRTCRRSSPRGSRRRRRTRCRCDRARRRAPAASRSQISPDSVSVSSAVILPTFLTATKAAGAGVPPKVMAEPRL